jgi:muramoyltetrapeptide carboxypeptidase LdcA involved in peptidoglycan recycling
MSAGALRFTYPPKPRPGDRVAVLSPSGGLPAVFPAPFELGPRRVREVFGLEPVEYPTTRRLDASPRQRAADVLAAFADPAVKAVLTSIGGEDQLKVLRHLDPQVLAAHPKPVFGYSDATNLLHLLWDLGIVGYHGGAVMVRWGRPGAMHPLTRESLRRALFDRGSGCCPSRRASPTRNGTGPPRARSTPSRCSNPPRAGRGTAPATA